MNSVAERIFELVDKQYPEQKAFASAIGENPSKVSQWRMGITKSYQRCLPQIAEALGTTTEYLLTGNKPAPASPTVGAVRIPVLGVIPAGIPIEAVEDVRDWEDIPAEWTTGDRQYFGLKVRGDSMYPKYLEGDTVILLKESTCECGDDCAVLVSGENATLKQVHLHAEGKLELRPLNPAYPPRTYTTQEVLDLPVTIAGVVVELRRKIK